jgi:hypothetical protein
VSEDLDALLTELESVTAEIAADDQDVSLEELGALGARRAGLIVRLSESRSLDEASLGRIRAVVHGGAEAECRVVRLRETLRGKLVEIERARHFTCGLASLVPAVAHDLDTQA